MTTPSASPEQVSHSRPRITIRPQLFHSSIAISLVTELDAELASLYPDWNDLPHPHLTGNPFPALTSADPVPILGEPGTSNNAPSLNFYIATVTSPDGQESIAGCGAFRLRGDIEDYLGKPEVAEVKRMYVRPTFRGRGISSALLRYIEEEIRASGTKVIVLESGIRQVSALKLYEKYGWRRRADYREWVGAGVEDGGVSVCYEKRLL